MKNQNHPTKTPKHSFGFVTSFPKGTWQMSKKAKPTEQSSSFGRVFLSNSVVWLG